MGQASKVWEIGAALSGLILAGSLFVPRPADKAVFLDVGQGDSILLQEKTAQILVDGGAGMAVLNRLGEELPFFDKTIDVVILTHPDRDHLEGLLHVLERYRVKLILLPQVPHNSQLYEEWVRRIQERGLNFRFASVGQMIIAGEMSVQILGPTNEVIAATRPGKTNNASVLARVDFAGLSFLLTGDAEAGVENGLVKREGENLDVDVFKAGHHGSKTSTSQALLDAVSPSAVVISVGADNSYGHPHPTVLQRLANIQTWRTDQHGSVEFEHVGEQWLLKSGK